MKLLEQSVPRHRRFPPPCSSISRNLVLCEPWHELGLHAKICP
jgi:hypothetical protein